MSKYKYVATAYPVFRCCKKPTLNMFYKYFAMHNIIDSTKTMKTNWRPKHLPTEFLNVAVGKKHRQEYQAAIC